MAAARGCYGRGRGWYGRHGPCAGCRLKYRTPRRGRDGRPAPHPWWHQPPTGMCRATRGPSQPPLRGDRGARRGPTSPWLPVAPPPAHPIAPPPPLAATRRHRAGTPPIPFRAHKPSRLQQCNTHKRSAGGALPARPSPTTPRRMPRPAPSSHAAHSLSVPSPIFRAPSRQHQQHVGVPSPSWKPAASATAVGRRQPGAHHGDGGGRQVVDGR